MTLDPFEPLPGGTSVAALRRFARPRPPAEQCELCGAGLPQDHHHLVEPVGHRLLCACDACAILFDCPEANRYRRVPRDVRLLADFRLDDATWDALAVPTDMAFFFHSSPAGRVVACYPSPGGPTESALELRAWQDVVRDNPALQHMQPDVEALLVNRIGQTREHYRVGVDQCYKLVGLVRAHWRGLSGGAQVWEEIAKFFAGLAERAGPVPGGSHG